MAVITYLKLESKANNWLDLRSISLQMMLIYNTQQGIKSWKTVENPCTAFEKADFQSYILFERNFFWFDSRNLLLKNWVLTETQSVSDWESETQQHNNKNSITFSTFSFFELNGFQLWIL